MMEDFQWIKDINVGDVVREGNVYRENIDSPDISISITDIEGDNVFYEMCVKTRILNNPLITRGNHITMGDLINLVEDGHWIYVKRVKLYNNG